MTQVIPRPNESVQKLLRRFKKKVEQAGILKDARKGQYYLKPSKRRRKKRLDAERRRRRTARRQERRDR